MADQSNRSHEDAVQALGEGEVAKALNDQEVARALGESVGAGGIVGLVLAGAAFLGVRLARVRGRRTAVGRTRRR